MDREEAIKILKEHIKPSDTLYTQLEHVTKSGMTRYIRVRQIKDDYPYDFTGLVWHWTGSTVTDTTPSRLEAVADMGFHLIYSLGRVLWPDGTPEPHGTRNGEPDSCGGYAIKQRWL